MLYLAALMFVLALSPNVFADDKMYKCDDGTFTNRADLHCPSYELRGSIMIMSGTSPMPLIHDKITDRKVMMTPVLPPATSHQGIDTTQEPEGASR